MFHLVYCRCELAVAEKKRDDANLRHLFSQAIAERVERQETSGVKHWRHFMKLFGLTVHKH